MLSESKEQQAVVKWARDMAASHPKYKCLNWLHAVPNGGFRNPREARRLKLEGVLRGVPDLFLPYVKIVIWDSGKRSTESSGLYIEMKSVTGRVSKEQQAFGEWAMSQGYEWVVCRGADEAIYAIKEYLELV